MVRKKGTRGSTDANRLPALMASKEEAERQIAVQIERGRALLESPIQGQEGLKSAKALFRQWNDYNTTMLRKLFDTNEVADEYVGYGGFVSVESLPWDKEIPFHRTDIQGKIYRLESIRKRLHHYEQPSPRTLPELGTPLGTDIFLVHGRNDAARDSVARFIEKLDLRAIILGEKPSSGRTIIEKFEEESSGVAYAVVLLTPDDIGAPADEPEKLKPRARQNVIFELGFLLGRLGRDRVCALYGSDIEIPSDYGGVVYVQMDAGGAWQLLLAREIRHAGIDVDLNKAV